MFESDNFNCIGKIMISTLFRNTGMVEMMKVPNGFWKNPSKFQVKQEKGKLGDHDLCKTSII